MRENIVGGARCRDYTVNMASTAWRTRLNSHPILNKLRENQSKLTPPVEAKSILSVTDGCLLVWNQEDCCILTVNLRNVEHNEDDASYQTFVLTNPPRTEIDCLVVNGSGTQVALVGRQTLVVVDLPSKWETWGKNTKQKILCRSWSIGEQALSGRIQIDILQASWHPGSFNASHLAVLTSDNYLRIYNTSKPHDNAQQVHCLGEAPLGGALSSHRRTFLGCLGDTAVAFDFGPPQQDVSFVNSQPSVVSAAVTTPSPPTVYPIYILRGNGDVYLLNMNVTSTLTSRRSFNNTIHGPLPMQPPAEDNYGVEACSIICLHTLPPLIVVATSSGNLHHCLVITRNKNDDEDDNDGGRGDIGSLPLSSPRIEDVDSDIFSGLKTPSLFSGSNAHQALHVIETVELELALSVVSLETGDLDEVSCTCPIRLMKDPSCPMRYNCVHSSGVNMVALPIIPQLERFLASNQDDDIDLLDTNQGCIVEHLVCTKPLSSSPPSPVLGVAIFDDISSSSLLLVLTADFEMVDLKLAAFYHDIVPPLLIDDANAPTEEGEQGKSSATIAEPSRPKAFDNHIRRLLQRNSSNPILKSSLTADLSPAEGLQLLGRVTQVFRVEYIQRLELARQEIQKRAKALSNLKKQQLSVLEKLGEDRHKMTESAQRLAERYEDACDQHAQLNARTETLLQKVQIHLPVVSDAERGMFKELKELDEKLKVFKNSVAQAQTKHANQNREKERHGHQLDNILSPSATQETATLSENRKNQLEEVLGKQAKDLSEIMDRLKVMKVQLGI